jgi:tetratricopeptide (TPR) repeat protein
VKWNLFVSISASLIAVAFMAWLMWRWVKNSDEPLVLVIRWIITAVVLGFVYNYAAHAHDEFSMIAGVLLGAVGGVIMIFVWRERFCGFVGDQIASFYTGGSQQVDPAPCYSMAEAKRKKGKYLEAIADIRAQLERFPTDFTGWMLLAEIQAENLRDVAAAHDTIEEILRQEGHAPKNIAFALTREADWCLKLTKDREAARAALEQIVALLPETEQAQLALQRLAHLTPPEMLAEGRDPRRVTVQRRDARIGIQGVPLEVHAPEEDPAEAAAQYVRHLEQFPADNEAREKLALLYAHHYQRLDLATDQLEQLISSPNQPPKEVVRWLNLLADLQVELAGDEGLARQTLQRIPDLYPRTAAAENAFKRVAHLKLELRPKQQSQIFALGSYEQNIGLKGGPSGPVPGD